MAPFGLLVTGASFAAFRGLHWGLQLLPTPGSAAQDRWKWRNICVSLVHSLLTGAGALLGCGLRGLGSMVLGVRERGGRLRLEDPEPPLESICDLQN